MVASSKLSQVFTYESWVHAVSGAAVSTDLHIYQKILKLINFNKFI